MIFEDFIPLSNDEAIVSRGASLTSLTEIARVHYAVDRGRVRLTGTGETLATGTQLRLGNVYDGILGHSDTAVGLIATPCQSRTGIQPFTTATDCYWNEPGRAIFRNGEKFLQHWQEGGAVGKPAAVGRWLYFEARDFRAKMPQGWEVWRKHLGSGAMQFICVGANPHPWGGWLFYTDFSDYPDFCTRRVKHDSGCA